MRNPKDHFRFKFLGFEASASGTLPIVLAFVLALVILLVHPLLA
jgi:hypothetical protein